MSQEILDSVDDTEKKRQEAINEVIYTERDFVRDLEYLRDVSKTSPLVLICSLGSSPCARKPISSRTKNAEKNLSIRSSGTFKMSSLSITS